MSAGLRGELERLGVAVSERPVRDLWPLELMRARAGAAVDPVLVARPATTAQAVEAVRAAAAAGVRVVPFGAASGVCGAVAPQAGELALDLAGMGRVLAVDEHDLVCTVEAGAVAGRLEEELNRRGLTLGHQPSSLPVSTLGGLISTRSSGQESSYYGNVEQMLLGLRAVLPDGTLVEPRLSPRTAVGPPLEQLFIGAEGALGVLLELTFRVHRLPGSVIGRGYLFETVGAGLAAVREVVQDGLRPLVIRLYDEADTAFQGVSGGGCLLVVASAAADAAVAGALAAAVARRCAAGRDLGEEPWTRWREHRYSLSVDRLREVLEPPGSFVDTIEVAAPWSRLEGLYAEIRDRLAGRGLALCHFSHAYAQGCAAYFTFAGSAATEEEARAAYESNWQDAVAACARTPGATVSHHHGVGRVRADAARVEMGGWWTVWELVRAALDPAGTMNPDAAGGRPR